MCNEPYVPKTASVTSKEAAATYESPFGEDNRPHTRWNNQNDETKINFNFKNLNI